jgi:predicted amidohydrolase
LRVALAQINPTVGDLDRNARLITDAIDTGRDAGLPITNRFGD